MGYLHSSSDTKDQLAFITTDLELRNVASGRKCELMKKTKNKEKEGYRPH